MNKHTIGDLYQMQSLPLKYKVMMTQQRIRGWYDHFDGQVYVSFSGGKDSTVLVDIITKMGLTDVPLVFVDTGLEYPEIREFVKGYGERVTWLKPKLNFKQVIEKYGYPFFGKETSEIIYGARKYLTSLQDKQTVLTDRQTDRYVQNARYMALLLGLRKANGKFTKETATAEVEKYLMELIPDYKYGAPVRYLILQGKLPHTEKGELKEGEYSSQYNKRKYLFMIDAPFEVNNACCKVMEKNPVHKYAKETGRVPITAQMASESKLRTQHWIKNGCNGFDMKTPISNPMSFWTEQDVLRYIKENDVPICSVYGDIVESLEGTEEVEGQLTMSDVPGWEDQTEFDAKRLPLKTTGCDRTGCMFCGYGCHLEKGEGRFVRMKRTHPKQYDYIMRPWEEGGLNYKEVIDWINDNGNMNIKY